MFFYKPQTVLKTIKHLFLFFILTVITQIGGIVYLVFVFLNKRLQLESKVKSVLLFLGLYLFVVFIIVPFTAPFFGREQVLHQQNIKPTNYLTVLLNRNYVKPTLNKLLQKTANELKNTGIEIRYLDANFPFINKFPLFPHLSHHDGRKIDLSFVYQDTSGNITTKQKSNSGYGVFEAPNNSEINQIVNCLNKGYWQYSYAKYMTFGSINSDLVLSKKGTKKLIQSLLKQSEIQKIFMEPHLKQRLHLTNKKIRYHGCQAVRHDDHIHLQIN
jgi:hypothetical protein